MNENDRNRLIQLHRALLHEAQHIEEWADCVSTLMTDEPQVEAIREVACTLWRSAYELKKKAEWLDDLFELQFIGQSQDDRQ